MKGSAVVKPLTLTWPSYYLLQVIKSLCPLHTHIRYDKTWLWVWDMWSNMAQHYPNI